jgi:subtilisin family serine protease
MFSNTNPKLKTEFENNYRESLSTKTPAVLLSIDMNCWLFTTSKNIDSLSSFIERIKQDKNIKATQLNYSADYRSTTPNDSIFSLQWNLQNTGQNAGTSNADISATEAWDITTGGITSTGDTMVIAVIDGGFQMDHPDLDFWKNKFEIPNDGIDNDSNTYIDDYQGWNTLAGNGNINNAVHGTHVAGIAGAKGNNNLGISGVNWNVKIMAVRGTSNPINDSLIIASYAYVLRQIKIYNETNGARGAFVVATNSSFGINNAASSAHQIWCEMYDSLGYAGIINATATANQNVNVDLVGDMPSTCSSEFMIAVTNTDNLDQLYTSAAYGSHNVDIAAPGTAIYSNIPNNTYGINTGTSMASPHVAGAISLMLSAASQAFIEHYKAHPIESALFLKQTLLNNVDSLNSLSNKCTSAGRLNLFKAVKAIQNTPDSLLEIREVQADQHSFRIIAIAPNPAQDQVIISFEIKKETELMMSLLDRMGCEHNLLFNKFEPGKYQQKIAINQYANGLYLLRVKSKTEYSNSIKLVIAKD